MPPVMLATPPAPTAGSLRTNGQCVVAPVVLTGGGKLPFSACVGKPWRAERTWLQIPECSVSQRQGLSLMQAKKELISKENSGFSQTRPVPSFAAANSGKKSWDL